MDLSWDEQGINQVEQSITLLGPKNILGIVLNGVEARDHLYYQYYGSTNRHQDE